MANLSRRDCFGQFSIAAPALVMADQVGMANKGHLLLGPFETFKVIGEKKRNNEISENLGALPAPKLADMAKALDSSRFFLLDVFETDAKEKMLIFEDKIQVLLSGDTAGIWEKDGVKYTLFVKNVACFGIHLDKRTMERKIDFLVFEFGLWAEKGDYVANKTSIYSSKSNFITYKSQGI